MDDLTTKEYLQMFDSSNPRIRIQADVKSSLEHMRFEMNCNSLSQTIYRLIDYWKENHPKPYHTI